MVEYLHRIPPGTRTAVFTLASRLRMIEGFTTDSGALETAIAHGKSDKAPNLPAQLAHLAWSIGGSPALEVFAEDGSVVAEVPWKRSQLPRIGDAIQIARNGQNVCYRVVDLTWKVSEAENPATQVISVIVTVRTENSPSTNA